MVTKSWDEDGQLETIYHYKDGKKDRIVYSNEMDIDIR